MGPQVRLAKSLAEGLGSADIVVLANSDPVFTGLKSKDFPKRPIVFVDCWRSMGDELAGIPGITYLAFGLGQDRNDLIDRLAKIVRTYNSGMDPWNRKKRDR